MAIDLKAIFGEAESMTQAELEAALDGKKLIDLNDGEYVKKEKLTAEVKKREGAETELQTLKAAATGDENAVAQIKTLTEQLEAANAKAEAAGTKLTRAERLAMVQAKVKNPKLAKVALLEAEEKVTDDIDFDTALEALLKSDPEYTADASKEADNQKAGTLGTGKPGSGAPGKIDVNLAAYAAGLGIKES